ncbi:hypothetical protein GC722_11840 [Auraticoccus sp. F435]|uniref:Uncharacterized protein n=1 Tax=Auraticoccus cholistanensis TaxID=2656650 RepID=A0A6A9V131_9ACTN|nr:hypothetical protein [Auraticoccus cholistanensis]MVA76709.1 hypothetical protein [Auraticoccus cholistanensis]
MQTTIEPDDTETVGRPSAESEAPDGGDDAPATGEGVEGEGNRDWGTGDESGTDPGAQEPSDADSAGPTD